MLYYLTYIWNLIKQNNNNKPQIHRKKLTFVGTTGGSVGELDEGSETVQTFSYEMSEYWACGVRHNDSRNTTAWYI